jgi:hypothetical protein
MATVPDAPPLPAVVMPTQAAPAWQPPPAQHSDPVAPQLVHIVVLPLITAQPRPVEHVRPLQQICPLPPQVVHIPTVPAPASAPAVSQASPEPHPFIPEQHAWPLAPHATHMLIMQRALEAVHVVGPPPPPDRPPAPAPPPPPAPAGATVPQQICPTAPHVVPVPSWHDPLLQVPVVPLPPMHADPLAWQRF